MQAAFRDAAARDVTELRAALEQQREVTAKMECQKQLLLKQACALLLERRRLQRRGWVEA